MKAEEKRVGVEAEALLVTISLLRPYRMGTEYLSVAEALQLAMELRRAADTATELGRKKLRDAESAHGCCH